MRELEPGTIEHEYDDVVVYDMTLAPNEEREFIEMEGNFSVGLMFVYGHVMLLGDDAWPMSEPHRDWWPRSAWGSFAEMEGKVKVRAGSMGARWICLYERDAALEVKKVEVQTVLFVEEGWNFVMGWGKLSLATRRLKPAELIPSGRLWGVGDGLLIRKAV